MPTGLPGKLMYQVEFKTQVLSRVYKYMPSHISTPTQTHYALLRAHLQPRARNYTDVLRRKTGVVVWNMSHRYTYTCPFYTRKSSIDVHEPSMQNSKQKNEYLNNCEGYKIMSFRPFVRSLQRLVAARHCALWKTLFLLFFLNKKSTYQNFENCSSVFTLYVCLFEDWSL